MSKTVTIKMSREDALKFGLLTCGNCYWPPNNHFDFGDRTCAHDSECKGYKEVARVGKLVKQRRGKTRKI
jgi:hypothetical protein